MYYNEYQNSQLTQKEIKQMESKFYGLSCNIQDLIHNFKLIVNELDDIGNYMRNRYYLKDITIVEMAEVENAIVNMKKGDIKLNEINSFMDQLRNFTKKRGYLSITPEEKWRIYNDRIFYGFSQIQLAQKYFTHQNIISNILKEFSQYHNNSPYKHHKL